MTAESRMSRRSCLKLIGTLSLGVSAPAIFFEPAQALAGKSLHEISRTLPLMNTLVSITVCDASRHLAEEAQEKGFRVIQDLIPIFDRFDPKSQVSWLNQNKSLTEVPPQLFEVLKTSEKLFYQSGKAFDVTILPLLERQQEQVAGTGKPPDIQETRNTLTYVGFEKIDLDAGTIRFSHPGTRITLDGIAKGYIVDQAASTLENLGVQSALINAGGDIRAIGDKGGVPWTIGLKDPLGRKRTVQRFDLANRAVATSGNYENNFDPLARHHHIISKRLGDSPRRIISASVLANTAMLADGLSTTLFLSEPEHGLRFVESLPDCEALIMTRGGRIFESSGWRQSAA